eukprot:scaffold21452_cov27-Cyclotella_meneghiniana.AAC.1
MEVGQLEYWAFLEVSGGSAIGVRSSVLAATQLPKARGLPRKFWKKVLTGGEASSLHHSSLCQFNGNCINHTRTGKSHEETVLHPSPSSSKQGLNKHNNQQQPTQRPLPTPHSTHSPHITQNNE